MMFMYMEGALRSSQLVDPLAGGGPSPVDALRFVAVVAAHAVLLWGGFELAARPEVRAAVDKVMVRLVEPPKPVAPPAKKEPPPPPKRDARPLPPPPVLTAAAEAPVPSNFTVPIQPPAPPVAPPAQAPVAAAPAAPSITAARFDADYLSNPKPVYPQASRRLGEEGKVVLRVRVSAEGTAMALEIRQSSGYARLDDSARSAVERWRFVPAKRGNEPVESWVLVPIVFSLQSS